MILGKAGQLKAIACLSKFCKSTIWQHFKQNYLYKFLMQ